MGSGANTSFTHLCKLSLTYSCINYALKIPIWVGGLPPISCSTEIRWSGAGVELASREGTEAATSSPTRWPGRDENCRSGERGNFNCIWSEQMRLKSMLFYSRALRTTRQLSQNPPSDADALSLQGKSVSYPVLATTNHLKRGMCISCSMGGAQNLWCRGLPEPESLVYTVVWKWV